jgi:enolase-phosphatase E1
MEFRGRGLLLDIEGTVSPIDFVHQTLFPYARRAAEHYLETQGYTPAVLEVLEQMAHDDGAPNFSSWCPYSWPGVEARAWVVEKIHAWMDRDAKVTGLKQLQGLIWERGYREGVFQATVFPDVPVTLSEWRASGIPVSIYSSGSIAAQKLFFEFTTAGDLTPHLCAYFDTTTGPKRSVESYRSIASRLAVKPEEILFLSDIPEELNAAREAGCATALVRRPGNAPVAEMEHPVVTSFDEIVVSHA